MSKSLVIMLLAAALSTTTATTARAQQTPQPGPSPAPAPSASSSGDDIDIAKAHFNTGQTYYEHGRFADAAREFEEAYRLSPKAPLLYNVGKSYDGSNDFARALDAYQRFLAAAPPDNPDRDFSAKRVEMLATLVGKVTVAGAVDGSAVTLDGKPAGTTPLGAPLIVNPGRHQLTLAHEGYATWNSPIDVGVGGNTTVAAKQTDLVKLVLVNRDKETPVYRKWWLWTAVGGAIVVAAVVTAVVVTSNGSNDGTPTVQLPQVK
ncbi:MAG TPA: tetratricopeptide repeat protein [Polyangia bacterium]|jgi:tetratricopeptide (TPR) repeat protein